MKKHWADVLGGLMVVFSMSLFSEMDIVGGIFILIGGLFLIGSLARRVLPNFNPIYRWGVEKQGQKNYHPV